MWVLYSVLAALFAALTTILAKVGISGINSNLATAIRTCVVLVMSWVVVYVTGGQKDFGALNKNNLIFLALSGLMTGLSWLCYYKAVSVGDVSRVAAVDKFSVVLVILLSAIFLKEQVGIKTIIGGVLITLGTIFMIF
ncbi:MAG: EamA family transporter [Clostridiaceae bacterium]|nr:EamA family transporter [Clostridiaceae bacterium]